VLTRHCHGTASSPDSAGTACCACPTGSALAARPSAGVEINIQGVARIFIGAADVTTGSHFDGAADTACTTGAAVSTALATVSSLRLNFYGPGRNECVLGDVACCCDSDGPTIASNTTRGSVGTRISSSAVSYNISGQQNRIARRERYCATGRTRCLSAY